LYFLDISWGDMGIPKLKHFSILQLISSFSDPYTWKLPSYKTKQKSISYISVSIILNQPLLASGFNSKPPHIKHILLYQLPQKFRDQKTKKESDKPANTNIGRNLSKQNSW
jgi:hypothetical protein